MTVIAALFVRAGWSTGWSLVIDEDRTGELIELMRRETRMTAIPTGTDLDGFDDKDAIAAGSTARELERRRPGRSYRVTLEASSPSPFSVAPPLADLVGGSCRRPRARRPGRTKVR